MRIQLEPLSKRTLLLGYENRSMLCRKIVAFCSEIYAKHTNALCGQNTQMLDVNLVRKVVTGL